MSEAQWMVEVVIVRLSGHRLRRRIRRRRQTPGETGPGRTPPVSAAGFRHLPATTRLDQTVASHPASDEPDPEGGRNAERDFMLRYAAL